MQHIGRFEVLAELGRGSMGQVYKVRDPAIGRVAAVKVVLQACADRDLVERFRVEAHAAGNLSHPNIVTIYELGEHAGLPYIAMEFLDGRDLERIIKDAEPLSMQARIDILCQAADGLHYAHQRGVVHRDVKPANMIVLPDGSLKIMDFGIAKVSDTKLTRTGSVLGTIYYVSPEQLRGETLDGRSDLFSLGVTAYQLISRRSPFPGKDIHAVMYHIITNPPAPLRELEGTEHAWLSDVIMRCLQKDRQARWRDCREFAAALRAGAPGASVVLRATVRDVVQVPAAPTATASAPAADAAVELTRVPAPIAAATPSRPARARGLLLRAAIAAAVTAGFLALDLDGLATLGARLGLPGLPQASNRVDAAALRNGPIPSLSRPAVSAATTQEAGLSTALPPSDAGNRPAPATSAEPTPALSPPPEPAAAAEPAAATTAVAFAPGPPSDAQAVTALAALSHDPIRPAPPPPATPDPAARTPAPAPPPRAALAAPAATLTPTPAALLAAGLVAEGDALFRSGRLLEPAGAAALDRYRAALALEPHSTAAQAGLEEIERSLVERAARAGEQGDLAQARRGLELAFGVRRHASVAARIEALTEAETLAGTEQAAEAAWRSLGAAPGPGALEAFLEAHPGAPAPLRAEAEQRLRSRRDDAAYAAAASSGDWSAMRRYLDEFQDGRHRDEASSRLSSLEKQVLVAFSSAERAGTPAAYELFLKQFPVASPVLREQARERASKLGLLDDARYTAAVRGTRGDLIGYVRDNPRGGHVAEALEMLDAPVQAQLAVKLVQAVSLRIRSVSKPKSGRAAIDFLSSFGIAPCDGVWDETARLTPDDFRCIAGEDPRAPGEPYVIDIAVFAERVEARMRRSDRR